jgi:hypothetical protein
MTVFKTRVTKYLAFSYKDYVIIVFTQYNPAVVVQRQCQVKNILDLTSFLLFIDSFLDIFKHSYGYAEIFRLVALLSTKIKFNLYDTIHMT